MAQIINDPHAGNVFGRIGRSFGQGLETASQGVAKGITQNQKANALERMGEQGNVDPLKSYGSLLRSGFEPSEATSLLPQIQNRSERQQFNKSKTTPVPIAKSENTIIPSEKSIPSVEKASEKVPKGWSSAEEISDIKSRIQKKPDQAAIDELAGKYLEQNANRTVQEARQLANAELEQNRAAQNEALGEAKQEFSEKLGLDLQNTGLGNYKDISGRIQNKFLDQLEARVVNGESPKKAADDLRKEAVHLGLLADKVKVGSEGFKTSTKANSDILTNRRPFEELGMQEDYDDIVAANYGYSPLLVGNIVDPIENQTLKKEIKSNKNNVGGLFGELSPIKEDKMKKIISEIKPNDNILSLEYELRENNIDISQFKKLITGMIANDEIALTKKQERQLSKPVRNDYAGDIFYKIF